ncbi:MAG: peptide chain release factor N(5)-glutamine methyltransferase [Elusimicrobia bacterium]|nr:peptide chain release factor N(5)-glutamine methyltransferase [Elusimicrobiota bacterium]
MGAWLGAAEAYLRERAVPEAPANAEFLMAAALKTGRNEVRRRAGEPLGEDAGRRFWAWVAERGRRVPLAYVLGAQPFMGLDLAVTPDVLVPRPETEELAAAALGLLAGRARPVILEIGTGSGCIALALAQALPEAEVFATDVSAAALALAARNAERNGLRGRVRFACEDLFRPDIRTEAWADLVVSNPPYVPEGALAGLEPEVQAEPRLALDGGPDGLDAVRAVAAGALRRLKPGGFLALEFGVSQGPAVRSVLESAGGRDVEIRKDAQGLERLAVARR